MTARKTWTELSQTTRDKRFVAMANNHLPKGRVPLPVMTAHSKCRDGVACIGPGCRFSR